MAIHLHSASILSTKSRYMEAVDTELYSTTWTTDVMEHRNTYDLRLTKSGFIIVLCNLCLFQTFHPLPFSSTYSAPLLFFLHCDIHIWCLILSCLCHFHPYFLLLFCFNLTSFFSSPSLPSLYLFFMFPVSDCFFCGLLFCPEDGSIRFLRNICKTTVSHPKRLHYTLI